MIKQEGNRKSSDIIFGIRAVNEAIRAGTEIDRIWIKKGLQGEAFSELFKEIRDHGISFRFVPVEKLDRVTRKNHQGVIAEVSVITYYRIEDLLPGIFEQGKMPFILLLDGITDVRNFGAIARTAECASVDAIIIPVSEAAQVNADAIKTSAGALLSLPVCRSYDLVETAAFLRDSGIRIIAATEKASALYFNADMTGPVAIVVGAEDTGIRQSLLDLADESVSVPLSGKIGSLNVSVAAGILIFEAVRQRNEKQYIKL
ncbi:MAG: 23S rRNA (guanosine(2251)-2'-O)-methyltransferase RlmB [Bacteroidetes bacterium]|nr:23S rRNA (guanosine(2251)-2'-O)-methyltransferase RlmB [Bacteroidota bacterium]